MDKLKHLRYEENEVISAHYHATLQRQRTAERIASMCALGQFPEDEHINEYVKARREHDELTRRKRELEDTIRDCINYRKVEDNHAE